MAVNVATLEARLIANTVPFDAAMTRSEGRMHTASKAMTVGALAVGAGVAFMATKAVNAAADYEAGLNTMQAVSGATADQMKQISKLAIALGNDIKLPGTSAKDAAEAMTELSKSGMSINQTLKAVRPTLLLSAAAQISNARAAEITSNALNAFGLDASRTSKVVDLLANAANASSLEIEDVADSMQMAGAVFKGMQGPTLGAENALKELTVATALLGNAGIKGSDAGTSLKQAILSLTGPAEKQKALMWELKAAIDGATITEEQHQAVLHGSAKVRREAIAAIEKTNDGIKIGGDIAFTAAGKMRPLHEIVGLVSQATKKLTDEERSYYVTQIFGADASRSIIALMGAQKRGWDDMSAALDKNGAAQDLAAAKMRGMRGAQEALKSTMDTLAITFGLVLLPYVTAVTQALTRGAAVIAEHRTAALIVTGVLVSFAAAILAVKTAILLYHGALLLATAATSAWTATQVLARAATVAWTAAQWLLNVALTANPIGIVIVAVAAFAAGIVIAYNRSETFREMVHSVWEKLKTLGGYLSDKFKDALTGARQVIDDVRAAFDKVSSAVDSAVGSIRNLVSWIGKIHIPSLPSWMDPRNIGDPFDPNMTLPSTAQHFSGSLMGANPEMAPFAAQAAAYGLQVTSGLRTGAAAITANGTFSDHGRGKALDLSNGYDTPQMAAYFRSLIGNRMVKQAFYDPIGSIFGGVLSSYREGGHTDHVHVATYDKGGWLKPGLTLAYNGTGAAERVGKAGGNTYNFNFPQYLGNRRELIQALRTELQQISARN